MFDGLRLCICAVTYDLMATGETRRRFVAVEASSPADAEDTARRRVESGWWVEPEDGGEDFLIQTKRVTASLHASYSLDTPANTWPT